MTTLVEENLEITVESGDWDSRIRCIKCGDLVRSYLIKTERFLLVYDTLLGPKSGAFLKAQAIEFAEGRPLMVVNSHADWDHYFGNMVFSAPILGTEVMEQRVSGGVGAKELEQKQKEHPDCYRDVQLVAPTVGLSGDTTLYGGDLTIKLLVTKGHRPDHLALYIPETQTLFPGDCVEDPIPLVDEDSDETSCTLDELVQSLQSFLKLEPTWVLANHAQPEPGIIRIQSNLSYLENLRDLAQKAASLEDLRSALPGDETWDEFYQKAHQKQTRMAWLQIHRQANRWADD